MVTPKLRWLYRAIPEKIYTFGRALPPPVLQQEVTDDKGLKTWVDVEEFYEEGRVEP